MKHPSQALSGLILAAFVFAGCAAIEDNPNTTRLVVKYATLKAIEQADDPAERQARIVQVAQTALDATADEDVLVSAIETAVRQAVKWENLSAADRFAADALITIVAQEISARVGEGVLDGEEIVTVRAVLQWVVDAAQVGAIDAGRS